MHPLLLTGTFLLLLGNSAWAARYTPEECSRANERNTLGSLVEGTLDIDPCPEAANNEPCVFKRGETTAIISFNFTTTRNVRRPKNVMAWNNIPFRALPPNACKGLNGGSNLKSCPIKKDTVTEYKIPVSITSNLPTGTFPVNFYLKDRNKIILCFIYNIKLE